MNVLDSFLFVINGHWVAAFCAAEPGADSAGLSSVLYIIALPCFYATLLYVSCRAHVELFKFELHSSVSDTHHKIVPIQRHSEDKLTGQMWGLLDTSAHPSLAKFDRLYVSVLDILPASRLLIRKRQRVKIQKRVLQKLKDTKEPLNIYVHASHKSIGFLDIGLPKAPGWRVMVLALAPLGVHIFLHNILCFHAFTYVEMAAIVFGLMLMTVIYYWGSVGAVLKMVR